MSDTTAQVSTVVNAPSKKVWKALTDPALIREYYMGATVSTDWQVGSPITFAGEWKGKTYEDKGKILEVRPDEELRSRIGVPWAGRMTHRRTTT